MLKAHGNFALALTAFHRAEKLASPKSAVAASLPTLIRQTENGLALANRLPGILKGEDKPKDGAEGLAFARLCCDQARYAAAARLWHEALAKDPKLAVDRQTRERYDAACAAALAAAGKSKDEAPPDDDAKARLRGLARGWLNAELAAWTKVLETGAENAKAAVVPTLRHWQNDPDLAAIRDHGALERLPEAERKDWQDFWAAVGALLRNTPGRP